MRSAPFFLAALALSAAACSTTSASPPSPPPADAAGDAPPAPTAWSALPRLTQSTLRAVWASGDVVIAVGEDGTVLRSTDGGATFQLSTIAPVTTPPHPRLYAVFGSSADDVYVAGSSTWTDGVLYHSGDRGATWTTVDVGPTPLLTSVWASGANDVYVGGVDGSILHSTDRGATWTRAFHDPAVSIYGLSGSGAEDVYAAGAFSGAAAAGDGGAGDAGDAEAGDADLDGEAAGPPPLGLVLHSTDRGASWSIATTETTGVLWSIAICPGGDTGYAVGAGASLAAMNGHGVAWSPVGRLGDRLALESVACATGSPTPFIAGGDQGFLIMVDPSAPGGTVTEGEALPGPGPTIVYGVWSTTRSDVWAVGAGGAMWHRVAR